MSRLRPSEIRYVQDSINNVFDQRSNHRNVMIGQTLDKLCEGKTTVDSIPTIAVYTRDEKYWSADNRRLWVFQQYERLGGCRDIPVILSSYWNIPSNKFTTYNEGKTIRVRGNPGGSWHLKPDNALAVINNNTTSERDSSFGTRYETLNLNNSRTLSFRRQITTPVTPEVFRLLDHLNRNEQHGDIVAGVGSLHIPRAASHTYLDPNNVKYTKKSIPSTFSGVYAGVPLRSVARDLLTSTTRQQISIPPVTVYRVYEEDRVVDGNRRLWAYRLARRQDSSIRIPAVIKTDVEEYKTKIRENNSKITLSLRDILLFDGDAIEIVED